MKVKFVLTLLVTLILIGIVWFISAFEWQKTQVEVGFEDEISKDSFTMTTRFLARYNIEWRKERNIESLLIDNQLKLDNNHVLILDEAQIAKSYALDSALSDWVARGGRLIYILSAERETLGIENSAFTQSLGLTVISTDAMAPYFFFNSEATKTIDFPINKEEKAALSLSEKYQIAGCPGDAYQSVNEQVIVCEFSYDQGRVTVIPSFNLFSNHGLRYLDHGAFLLWLVDDADSVVFVPYLSYPNWLVKLWMWSWQFVVACLLAIILFVWHTSARFGRAYQPSNHVKTRFSEHVQAVANYYFSHHQHVLVEALKKDFYQKVETRVPNFNALSVDKQAEVIANLSSYNKENIVALLAAEFPSSKEQQTEYIKRFKELRNAL